jgi:hypothetical protein
MNRDQLHARSKQQLASLARKRGISGWEQMKKDELVTALVAKHADKRQRPKAPVVRAATAVAEPPARVAKDNSKKTGKPDADNASKPAKAIKPVRSAARDTSGGISSGEEQIERAKFDVGIPTKDLSLKVPKNLPTGYGKDRVVLMVRDPFWLHCYWEITHHSIQRAEAALGQDWHGSKPILRVVDVTSQDTTSTSESVVREIEIHGGCNNWYIEVNQPPRTFRVDVGYISRRGQFYVLARSNTVSTPRANISDTVDENWADFDPQQADRIFAMSSGFDPAATSSSIELKQMLEERLRRPLGSPSLSSFGSGALGSGKGRKFWFQLDAELIVFGATEPNARVTLQGEPVKLRPDGTFTMRFSLPDSRQIIPAVAVSVDGVEERTIVLAVERNTKQLEPLVHEIAEAP